MSNVPSSPPSVQGLDVGGILAVLPHRWPWVLVDRVTLLEPRVQARGYKNVAMSEPWFQGHFPGQPLVPGVLVLDALAQLGIVLAASSEPFDPDVSMMYFLGVDKVKFRRAAVPGDRIDLHVTVVDHTSNVWKFYGEALVDGALSVQGELLASVVDRDR